MGSEAGERIRVRIFQQSAALSRIVESAGKKLMLRVD
jgi:hypothetical protein